MCQRWSGRKYLFALALFLMALLRLRKLHLSAWHSPPYSKRLNFCWCLVVLAIFQFCINSFLCWEAHSALRGPSRQPLPYMSAMDLKKEGYEKYLHLFEKLNLVPSSYPRSGDTAGGPPGGFRLLSRAYYPALCWRILHFILRATACPARAIYRLSLLPGLNSETFVWIQWWPEPLLF